MEAEHEVYGGDIPCDDGDMEGSDDPEVDIDRAEDVVAAKMEELAKMKMRLKEMEEEAAALKEMQAKIDKETALAQDPAIAATTEAMKNEADSRSVYVGNGYSLAFQLSDKTRSGNVIQCLEWLYKC